MFFLKEVRLSHRMQKDGPQMHCGSSVHSPVWPKATCDGDQLSNYPVWVAMD